MVEADAGSGGLPQNGTAATEIVVSRRPTARPPKPARFPALERSRLASGLSVVRANVPGRRMAAVRLVLDGGAAEDPPAQRGLSSIVASALTEGTERRTALEFLEAAESLGAELRADAGWHTTVVTADVPIDNLGPALELLAEIVRAPAFPEREIERIRGERLNDLLQARGDPKRTADLEFARAIYAPGAAYGQPHTGLEETLTNVTLDAVTARHAALARPSRATLVIAADLGSTRLDEALEKSFADWTSDVTAGSGPALRLDDRASPRRVILIDRPGAPQTELRIGHVGLPRVTPDYFAVQVMIAILGGLFNSRLQLLLRDQLGYTYGVTAGFDMRRRAGPFGVRTAVQADATVAALRATLDELGRIREQRTTDAELREAREYLTGSFALRHATASQIAGAIVDIVANELPDDEMDRYRPGIATVTSDDVLRAARAIQPDAAFVVAVGDAAAAEAGLRELFGTVERTAPANRV